MEILLQYKKVKDVTSRFKNHFQLKSQIYVTASKVAFTEVTKLKSEIADLKLLVSWER